MSQYPKFVSIHEEGPREGFQFEKQVIPTEIKVQLIERLAETGLEEIQTVSFVNPKRVPGMADAEEVVKRIKKIPGVRYTGLWLNDQGLQRALATERLDIKARIGLCASETFIAKNQNSTLQEMIEGQKATMRVYQEYDIFLDYGVVQAAFGCNFQGDVPVSDTLSAIDRMKDIAAEFGQRLDNVVLADTMAWAVPNDVERMARHGHRECVSRTGKRCEFFRCVGGRSGRLSLWRTQGSGRERLHRRSGVHV
jgi:hydroxymethylglutaryl-CoA lyase